MMSEFPPEFRPSTVTFFAPFKSIKWPETVPEIVRAPLGLIVKEFQAPVG